MLIFGFNSFSVVLCIYKVSVYVPCDTNSPNARVLRKSPVAAIPENGQQMSVEFGAHALLRNAFGVGHGFKRQ